MNDEEMSWTKTEDELRVIARELKATLTKAEALAAAWPGGYGSIGSGIHKMTRKLKEAQWDAAVQGRKGKLGESWMHIRGSE